MILPEAAKVYFVTVFVQPIHSLRDDRSAKGDFSRVSIAARCWDAIPRLALYDLSTSKKRSMLRYKQCLSHTGCPKIGLFRFIVSG